jgi:D-tyrosyl-tRNA(Tyr) deacylase
MAGKVVQLRIFADDQGKMNRSIAEVGGKVLAVSQFTLFGDTRKGRRPSFVTAANPEAGKALYEKFIRDVRAMKVPVEAGIFQADMQVELVNDGPVTILIDSRKQF